MERTRSKQEVALAPSAPSRQRSLCQAFLVEQAGRWIAQQGPGRIRHGSRDRRYPGGGDRVPSRSVLHERSVAPAESKRLGQAACLSAYCLGMSSLDENPNCAKTYATFRLRGDQLAAKEVTVRLDIEADFAFEKGELHSSGRGQPVKQRIGVWYITSEGRLETTNTERHLLDLLEKLEPVKEELRAVVQRQSLVADFFCYWVSATGHGGPEVSPDTLRRIADLDARLGFDFYGPFADDDAETR